VENVAAPILADVLSDDKRWLRRLASNTAVHPGESGSSPALPNLPQRPGIRPPMPFIAPDICRIRPFMPPRANLPGMWCCHGISLAPRHDAPVGPSKATGDDACAAGRAYGTDTAGIGGRPDTMPADPPEASTMLAATPFHYLDSWQHMTLEETQAVQAFWLRENAHVEGAEAARRVHEVVIRAVTLDGQLAAITTVEPRLIPRLMQPLYYYRCFVGAAWRNGGLLRVRVLLQKTVEVLEAWASVRDYPCIGVICELENEGFGKTLQRAYWSNGRHNGYSYIGRSARGLDMRVRYFIGARLKTPQEVAALLQAAGATVTASATPQSAAAIPVSNPAI
jgi:hypothetical protein